MVRTLGATPFRYAGTGPRASRSVFDGPPHSSQPPASRVTLGAHRLKRSPMRRLGFLIVVLLLLAACTSPPSSSRSPSGTTSSSGTSSASSTSSASGTSSVPSAGTGVTAPVNSGANSGGSPFEPLPPGITVKDAYTSVMVQVTNPPTFPFPGTDGRYHVAYNLVLPNASRSRRPSQARRGRRGGHQPGHRLVLRHAAGRPVLRLRRLQPAACPSLGAGDRARDPAAGGAGALRRLRVRHPRGARRRR